MTPQILLGTSSLATSSNIGPFLILFLGTAVVLGIILVARLNAFIALISGAFVVSLLAPGDMATRISRVAEAFGKTTGSIGIVIAFAAIIGICMMKSGAADRIVQFFLRALGEKRGGPIALTASGFVLSIPVFFDTVFYLLVPLARSLFRKTKKNYIVYLVAIAAGSAVTHTLVPPTPGPIFVANEFHVDLGLMIMIGCLVGIVSSAMGLLYGHWLQTKMNITMRPIAEEDGFDETLSAEGAADAEQAAHEEQTDEQRQLPSLFYSVLPIVVPIGLIALKTIVDSILESPPAYTQGSLTELLLGAMMNRQELLSVLGEKNFALGISAALAMFIYWVQCRPSSRQFSRTVESALMSGGVIILITAAGGAFGAMLREAQLGGAIESLLNVSEKGTAQMGFFYLFVGFGVAALFKTCQGSSTTAMMVTPGIVLAMIPGLGENFQLTDLIAQLGYHPVYLALAIGSGSLCLSWMNDSGFWIFSKMGGLTEAETLKSWSVLLLILGVTSMAMVCLLATIMPMNG